MKRLTQAMLLLIANEEPLGAEWRDHALKGGWADHREFHIGGDFLLIYQLEDALLRTGQEHGAVAHTGCAGQPVAGAAQTHWSDGMSESAAWKMGLCHRRFRNPEAVK